MFASARLLLCSQHRTTLNSGLCLRSFKPLNVYAFLSQNRACAGILGRDCVLPILSQHGREKTRLQDFYCGIISCSCWFCLVPLYLLPLVQSSVHQLQVMTAEEFQLLCFLQVKPFFFSLFLAAACYPFWTSGLLKP